MVIPPFGRDNRDWQAKQRRHKMKKYLLLMILLNTSFVFSQYLPNMTNMTEAEKMMVFQAEKKSPALAVGLSFLCPTAGHAYAGNWKRGIGFQVGKVAGLFVGGFVLEVIGVPPTEGAVIALFTAVFGLGAIWEYYDAAKTTVKFNNNLYKNIFGREPNLNIGFVPHTNGANIVFSLNL